MLADAGRLGGLGSPSTFALREPDARRPSRRGLLSPARGCTRARTQPRPAAQQLGPRRHRHQLPHGQLPGCGLRPPGGDEPGHLLERRRLADHDRLGAQAPARSGVRRKALRHRARARRPRPDVRAGGADRRLAGRHPGGRHVSLVVCALARLSRVPASAPTDPRPTRRDDRGERARGGRELALLPGRLGDHPERSGPGVLPAQRAGPHGRPHRGPAAALPGPHRAA